MDQTTTPKPVMGDMSKVCNCPHHKVVPILIILIGLNVILSALGVYDLKWMAIIVGALLIVIGGTKIGGSKCGCCSKA
jgi:hypothetical protein